MADKILIVDDDPAICKLLEKVMHSNELETTTVNCGMDALSILKNHTFDLILMDIQMPIMNGYEAAAKIRRIDDRKKADIPIIALTANAFSEDKDNAIKAGMNDHVPKPIDMNVLLPAMLILITGK